MKAAIKRTIVILLLLVFVQACGKPPQNRDDELSDARNNVAAAVAHALSEPRSDKVLLQALPARDWREATPLGNGRLGALVHGRASDERVTFNHEALYNWASRGEMPDLSGLLPKVRALLAEGRFAEANRLYPEALKASGYKSATGKFFPAFDLRLRCGTDGVFCDYARELDMSRGVCTVRWTDDGGTWERTSFVCCANGASDPFVMRVRRDGRRGRFHRSASKRRTSLSFS